MWGPQAGGAVWTGSVTTGRSCCAHLAGQLTRHTYKGSGQPHDSTLGNRAAAVSLSSPSLVPLFSSVPFPISAAAQPRLLPAGSQRTDNRLSR
jgi:hypothetical protein